MQVRVIKQSGAVESHNVTSHVIPDNSVVRYTYYTDTDDATVIVRVRLVTYI